MRLVRDPGRGSAAPASEGGDPACCPISGDSPRHGHIPVYRAGTASRARADASAHPWSPHPTQSEVTPAPLSCPLGEQQEVALRLELLEATSAAAAARRCRPRETAGPWSRLRAGLSAAGGQGCHRTGGWRGTSTFPSSPPQPRWGEELVRSPFGLNILIKQCL